MSTVAARRGIAVRCRSLPVPQVQTLSFPLSLPGPDLEEESDDAGEDDAARPRRRITAVYVVTDLDMSEEDHGVSIRGVFATKKQAEVASSSVWDPDHSVYWHGPVPLGQIVDIPETGEGR
jgi:hypothetical protein